MPLDPQIALNTIPPPQTRPLQTLGSLMQLREQSDINDSRQLINEQHRRQLEDDDAITQAVQASNGNPDTAIDTLYKAGKAGPAGKLSESVLKTRKERAEGFQTLVKTHKDGLDFATNILAGVDGQKALDTARPALTNVLQQAGMGDFVSMIPTQYDPDQIQKLVQMGAGAATKLKNEHDALENKKTADELVYGKHRDAEATDAARQKADGLYRQYAATKLSNVRSQDDLDAAQRFLAGEGVPTKVLAEFGNQFDPQFGQRALKLGMTPAEQSTAQHQETDEGLRRQEIGVQQGQLQVAKDREAREASTERGPNGKPITQNEIAQVQRWKANQLADLEKRYRGPDPNIPFQPDADAKARMGQEKVQIENSARAQLGQPSLFEAEHDAASKGDSKTLRQVRNVYRALTQGQDTPLEKMEKLAGQIKAEKNPTKAQQLRQQLQELRDSYDQSVNR